MLLPGGDAVADDPARLDMDVVHAAVSGSYRASGRSRALVERSFANSFAFGVIAPDGATVGFGRLVTDRTVRAHMADVMVLPVARGRGLGRSLVAAMLDHPELATVATRALTTANARALYARFGFRPSVGDPNSMVLQRRVA